MSASREKKERQGGTPSNKAQTAQQQAEATRRKTIQYTVIGVVVAVLVAALLFWNTGFIQRRVTAATVNGTNYSVGEVNYFYHSTYAYQYAVLYARWGFNTGYDVNLAPSQQIYSTDSTTGAVTTYHDYFLQAALNDLETVTALYDAAIAAGYTTADVKDEVAQSMASARETASSNGYSSLSHFLTANYSKYVTPSIYESVLTRTTLANRYADDHQDSLEYGDAALDSYYNEHADELDTFAYSHLYFTPEAVPTTDDKGNAIEMTDEEKAAAQAENLTAAKEKAEAVKAALAGGKSAADLAEEYAPTSSGIDATVVGKNGLNSLYSDWLADSARKEGDAELFENGTTGYYVVLFQGRYLDQTPSANVRHILIRAALDEGATTPTDEQMAAAKAQAEEVLSQWKAGAANEDSFAALAEELSEDGRDEDGNLNAPGGLYEKVVPDYFVPGFNDWLFKQGDHAAGDTGVIENNGASSYYGYHVAYFVGYNEGDLQWKRTATSSLTSEEMTQWLEGLKEGYTATQANGIKNVGD